MVYLFVNKWQIDSWPDRKTYALRRSPSYRIDMLAKLSLVVEAASEETSDPTLTWL